MVFLQILAYLSVATFAALGVARVVRYAHLPMHLRWELYPIAHEKGHPSGGSYYETLDWWTKPRPVKFFGEMKFMGRELFFFTLYYRLQRRYWYVVYPFHIGVFLLVAWLLCLLIAALTPVAGIPLSARPANAWGNLIYSLTITMGAAGFISATVGCIGLLVERSFDVNRRLYTAPADYFTLFFTLAALLSGLFAWLFFDPSFTADTRFMKSFITLTPMDGMNPATYLNILFFCLFLLYMPFTSMTHYAAKYFTYHRVRWNDEPNLRGSKMERNVQKLLNRPLRWSAPHIESGKKWSENAAQVGNVNETEASK
jgi:nitrate reductase gamma subunit